MFLITRLDNKERELSIIGLANTEFEAQKLVNKDFSVIKKTYYNLKLEIPSNSYVYTRTEIPINTIVAINKF